MRISYSRAEERKTIPDSNSAVKNTDAESIRCAHRPTCPNAPKSHKSVLSKTGYYTRIDNPVIIFRGYSVLLQ